MDSINESEKQSDVSKLWLSNMLYIISWVYIYVEMEGGCEKAKASRPPLTKNVNPKGNDARCQI